MNPYDVLKVSKNATPEQLKKSRQALAKTLHPDRDGGDAESMAEVNRAYDLLSDPERRKRFDETGDTGTPKTIDAQAFELIVTGVRQLISAGFAGDLSREISRQISIASGKASAEIARLDAVVSRCADRISKIQNPEHPGAVILIRGLESLRDEQGPIKDNIEKQRQVMTRALEILDGVMESSGFGPTSSTIYTAGAFTPTQA